MSVIAAPTPLRVTICGLDELADHCALGVTHVLSILDPGWPEPEPLRDFELSRRLKLNFHDVIEAEPGWIAPERFDVELLLAFGRSLGEIADEAGAEPAATHLLVHCHAGVSRSTAAAILLLAQHEPARPAQNVVGQVIRARPRAWPNLRMIEMGDELLGRDGEIVASVRALYRLALDREPWLAEAMIDNGRGREVAAAEF
ncbi:MAG TPA: protein-tyrosine-phosphatase [Stellaceae bacterium]|nr:protein-tyrosine-phosphatase [Stellaceae bacterium]